MPMALLLPWCRITQPYMVGEIQLLPFTRDAPDIQRADDIDQDAYQAINRLLAPYRDLAGQSIERAAIVTYNGRKIIDELSEEEIATARELVEMACFSALAQRNLFSDRGPTCNRDVFTLYAQKFAIPIEMIAIETAKSRGAGRVISGWSIDKLCITVPAHVAPSSEVTIDDNLL